MTSVAGNYIAVDSISPSNVSTNACTTSGGGTAWSYVIEALAGQVQSLPDFNTPPDYTPDPALPVPEPHKPAGPPIYIGAGGAGGSGSACLPGQNCVDVDKRGEIWGKDPNYDGHGHLCMPATSAAAGTKNGRYHLVRMDASVDPTEMDLQCTYITPSLAPRVKRQWRQLFMR